MLKTKPNVIEVQIKSEDVYFSLISLFSLDGRADSYLDSVLIGYLYFNRLDTDMWLYCVLLFWFTLSVLCLSEK